MTDGERIVADHGREDFNGDVFYLRFTADRLAVRFVGSGREYGDIPEVALDDRGRIVAIGSGARVAFRDSERAVSLQTPFADSGIVDVDLAAIIVQRFAAEVGLSRIRFNTLAASVGPSMIIHPMGEWADDLTDRDAAALREVGKRAGASEVRLWTGSALSDDQIDSFEPRAYWV